VCDIVYLVLVVILSEGYENKISSLVTRLASD